MFDIVGNATDPLAARLSNFTDRPFVFNGVRCAGLEGPIQAFKCPFIYVQVEVCALPGKAAKKRGREFVWKDTHLLWWNGVSFDRFGRGYADLVTQLYDAAYDQDPRFMQDLLAVGTQDLRHSIGNTDMRETVLTEVEMIHQLNRLRIRAIRESR
ncbi:MAG: hypothetical protein KBD06_04440 [Candidatus Pacebacteria bacterium]|nr:hypothetical protein [Candidatus Paceibacterota bacterium]